MHIINDLILAKAPTLKVCYHSSPITILGNLWLLHSVIAIKVNVLHFYLSNV